MNYSNYTHVEISGEYTTEEIVVLSEYFTYAKILPITKISENTVRGLSFYFGPKTNQKGVEL